jgi:hypothetical protein
MIKSPTDVFRGIEFSVVQLGHYVFLSVGIRAIFWLDTISALGIAVWALYILPL